MKINKFGAGVFTIENLLSKDECIEYINLSEKEGYEVATIQAISGPEINTEIRHNDRVIYDSPELASLIFDRVKGYLPSVSDGW